MNLLKSLFGKKEEPIKSNADFWNWFTKHEKPFFNAVKTGKNIEEDFFDQLSPKLNELKPGFFFLTGMFNDTTAELVLTADGDISHIAFIEDLVNEAPTINNWIFTALKPAMDIKNVSIEMAGHQFNSDNLFFYADEIEGQPDEIDITIIHNDFNEDNKTAVTNGTFIFLDNFLGELNFATMVDNLEITGKQNAGKELIPIERLKPYLVWREKEFVEKYEGLRHDTENDAYATMEAKTPDGKPVLAIINTELLQWDSKASHPWILNVEIKYNGDDTNGMPDVDTYQLLSVIEDEIMSQLKDADGYLNIGRQTVDGIREIYFACNDFRKPSKVLYHIQQKYGGQIHIDYDIYKDKYWQSLSRFIN
jgi:hypothetical protein